MCPEQLDEESARRLLTSGLGTTLINLAVSYTAPLCWLIPEEGGSKFRVRNGSAFFLDAGEGPFGVTAAHVIEDYKQDKKKHQVEEVKLLNIPFDIENKNRIISIDEKIDLATFEITSEEIELMDKTIMTAWPPIPPQQDRGVFLTGFPSVETISPSTAVFGFGAHTIIGVASSISEKDISIQIEREQILDILGLGLPTENYNFGGMSGGPVLALIDRTIQSWVLAGVVYEGPNISSDRNNAISNFEIIKARRAHFILPNGKLDIQRWAEIN